MMIWIMTKLYFLNFIINNHTPIGGQLVSSSFLVFLEGLSTIT